MGNVKSQLDPEDVEDYVALSYLTHRQIYRLFERFKDVDRLTIEKDKDARLPIDTLLKTTRTFPELQDRLLQVFSSEEDDCLSFEDFIDLVSVFSEQSDETLKSTYAFQIFDIDGDGYIGRNDIEEILRRLTSKGDRHMGTPASVGDNGAFNDGPEGSEPTDTRSERRSSRRGLRTPSDIQRSSSDRQSHRSTTTIDVGRTSGRKTLLLSEDLIKKITDLKVRLGRFSEVNHDESSIQLSPTFGGGYGRCGHKHEQVIKEADFGEHGAINLQEFIHLTSKIPDFTSSFTIRF